MTIMRKNILFSFLATKITERLSVFSVKDNTLRRSVLFQSLFLSNASLFDGMVLGKIFVDRAAEYGYRVVNRVSLQLCACGVEMSAAADLFQDQLDVDHTLGTRGYMNAVTYAAESKACSDALTRAMGGLSSFSFKASAINERYITTLVSKLASDRKSSSSILKRAFASRGFAPSPRKYIAEENVRIPVLCVKFFVSRKIPASKKSASIFGSVLVGMICSKNSHKSSEAELAEGSI